MPQSSRNSRMISFIVSSEYSSEWIKLLPNFTLSTGPKLSLLSQYSRKKKSSKTSFHLSWIIQPKSQIIKKYLLLNWYAAIFQKLSRNTRILNYPSTNGVLITILMNQMPKKTMRKSQNLSGDNTKSKNVEDLIS